MSTTPATATATTVYGSTYNQFIDKAAKDVLPAFEQQFNEMSEGQQVVAALAILDTMLETEADEMEMAKYPYLKQAVKRAYKSLNGKYAPDFEKRFLRTEQTDPAYLQANSENEAYPEWFREMNKELLRYVQAYNQTQPA